MKAKHEDIFKQFSATFAPPVIKPWTSMVEHWESDPLKPNPYEEPRSGNVMIA